MAPFSIMDLFDDVNGKLFAFEKKSGEAAASLANTITEQMAWLDQASQGSQP